MLTHWQWGSYRRHAIGVIEVCEAASTFYSLERSTKLSSVLKNLAEFASCYRQSTPCKLGTEATMSA